MGSTPPPKGPEDSTESASAGPAGAAWRSAAADPGVGPAPPPAPPVWKEGEELAGTPFKIVRMVGSGGFGVVYEALRVGLGRRVALKVVWPPDRFRRSEGLAQARLDHPNLVAVYSSGTVAGVPYLEMEWVEAPPGCSEPSLAELVQRHGRLTRDEAVGIALAVAKALHYLHDTAGVLHCDLKPDNVLVSTGRPGESLGERVRVGDFGLARLVSVPTTVGEAEGLAPGAALDSVVGGTPGFWSPEQAKGRKVDARADVWGFGALLFWMLSGQAPFPDTVDGARGIPLVNSQVRALPSDLDDDLREVVRWCLAELPEDRFQTAAALVTTLEACVATSASQGSPTVVPSGSPFRYLTPFGIEDASWFSGRDQEIEEYCQRIRHEAVITVTGESGAGKSSFVLAGLVPRLQRADPSWEAVVVQPRDAPLRNLARALRPLLGRSAPGEDILHSDPDAAGRALDGHAQASGDPVVLVVDQCEEVFGLEGARAEAERGLFFDAVAGAARGHGVHVVVTCRPLWLSRIESFQARLCRAARWLGKPDRAALEQALAVPLGRAGYTCEEADLPARLTAALASETTPLPTLQLAASKLWERRDEVARRIPAGVLESLGGVGEIVFQHADGVLRPLDAATLAAARDALCALVSPEGTRRRVRREQLLRDAGDPGAAAAALDRLVDEWLVTEERDDEGRDVVGLSSEFLLGWPALLRWRGAEPATQQILGRARRAAEDWDGQGRPDRLLWDQEDLAEARALGREDVVLPARVRVFLELSRRHEARRKWRLRGLVGAVLVLFAAVGAYGWYQRAQAEARLRDAVKVANEIEFVIHRKLEPIAGTAEVRKTLLKVAADLLDRLEETAEDDPARLRSRMVGHNQRGDLARSHDDLALARQEYEAAFAIAQRLTRIDSANPLWQDDLAVSHGRLGDVARVAGNLEDARAHHQAALAIKVRLAKADPTDRTLRRLAASHQRLGDVARSASDLEGARAHHQAALTLIERLAKADPTNPQLQRDLSVLHNRLGYVALAAGNLKEARAHYQADLAISERRARADPVNAQRQRDLSFAHQGLGDLALRAGDREEARAHYRAALALRDGLVKADPTNDEWRADHTISLLQLGKLGDQTAAERARAALKAAHEAGRLPPDHVRRFDQVPATRGEQPPP